MDELFSRTGPGAAAKLEEEVEVKAKSAALHEAKSYCESIEQELAACSESVSRLEDEVKFKSGALDEAQKHLRKLEQELTEHRLEKDSAEQRIARLLEVQQAIAATLTKTVQQASAVQVKLDTILNSSIWRITDRLRQSQFVRNPMARRVLRRFAKLVWWTATLQLVERVKNQIHAQREAKTHLSSAPAVPPLGGRISVRAELAEALKVDLRCFLDLNRRLCFPEVSQPEISIVLVLWNQAHFTLGCLQALHYEINSGNSPSFEVILVDNQSVDETGQLLARLGGCRIIRNDANLGFSQACNQGAEVACGRTILLLNNDAFVRQGALREALNTLDQSADIGAVGGRIILANGKLQEAGSIVWSDGSAAGYLRNMPPEIGEAMFRRDVDFCSAAFLLTPKKVWIELGGFDLRYTPAYYEDADFCMRLWESGYRVVYEPDAVLDHFEGGSETKSGQSVALTLRNRQYFRERHSAALRSMHMPVSPDNLLAARSHRRAVRPAVLMIDNEVPLQSLGAGYPRFREILLEAVSLGWDVSFFPMHQTQVNWRATRAEFPREIEIISDRAHGGLIDFLEQRRGHYSVIFVSRPDNMQLFLTLVSKHPHLLHGTRLVYDAEALFANREIEKAAATGIELDEATAIALIDREVKLAASAAAVACVNENEAEAFRSRNIRPVLILGHSIATRRSSPSFSTRNGFLFVGRLMERESPNWVALTWFIREIWPCIRQQLPDATLSVVGRLHPEHNELAAAGVALLGPVDDLAPVYDAARVFIAPIRFAAGIPIKIIEASAAGLPTVATSLMGRQLRWNPDAEILNADDPKEFARACIELHASREQWTAIRDNAMDAVDREFGKSAFRKGLATLLGG